MNKIIHTKTLKLLAGVTAFSLLFSPATFADPVEYSTPYAGDDANYQLDGDVTLNVNVAEINALEITLSTSNLVIDLAPKVNATSFNSDTLNILVGTSNSTGYTLAMSSIYDGENTTSLTRTEQIGGKTPTIDTLTSATSLDAFSSGDDTNTINKWGYQLSTTNLDIDKTLYNPILASNIINSSTEPISNDPSSITFAAKVDNELPAGNYRTILRFTAVANPTTRDFSAAYKAAEKSTATYSDTDYYTMQDMDSNICEAVDIGEIGTLLDTRDNTTYIVGKAKDDNCWMLQNLKLGAKASSYTLNNSTSNVSSSGFTLKGKLTNAAFTPSGSWTNDSSQFYCNSYNCYYNWYAATAGSGSSSVGNKNVDYSICPRGWVLPTGGANGQFAVLSAAYDDNILVGNSSISRENNFGEIPGFVLNGYASNSSSILGVGSDGWYWTRTSKASNEAYNMRITTTAVLNNDGRGKYGGNTLRCLAE